MSEPRLQPAAWERRSASDDLTAGVLELIRDSGIEPSQRLPSVQRLATRFGVAPPTMREVLRRLQAIGIIDIRHGSGMYLRRHSAALVLPNPHPGRLTVPTIRDLLDARLLIEPPLARLAAERAGETDLADLTETLAVAGNLLHDQDRLLGRLNMTFHRNVAQVSQSSVLTQVIDSLTTVYEDEQLVVMRLYDNRERDYREHLWILEAIAAHAPSEAERRMRVHLEGVRGVLGDDALPAVDRHQDGHQPVTPVTE
ncbi:MAG: FCD domain-containing protein [Candidatus Dormiibacterota bacterium]